MNKKGFTLVELLAVIAILAILVIIALPNVLKMFNDSKKNTFLTEAKTIYKEAANKYISESMKGNRLKFISSNDNSKLDLNGRDINYCIRVDKTGNVVYMIVGNGEYAYTYDENKSIEKVTISDLTDDDYDSEDYSCVIKPKSFSTDNLSIAIEAIKEGKTENYKVGDTREIELKELGKHTIRISNMSTPDECKQDGFSQSACGFVIEFADILTTRVMNETKTCDGGWPVTVVRKYLNEKVYNLLPDILKDSIISTTVVSGYGARDSSNFVSSDKLYLLASDEIWESSDSIDTAKDKTRQLDYYKQKGVTSDKNHSAVIKKNSDGKAAGWWTRSIPPKAANFYFISTIHIGSSNAVNADISNGVSPAFRIG